MNEATDAATSSFIILEQLCPPDETCHNLNTNNNNNNNVKVENFLTKSNDCLVIEMEPDDEHLKSTIQIGNNGNMKKSVLFDVDSDTRTVDSFKSTHTLGNNIRRISSNLTNRITKKKNRESRKPLSQSQTTGINEYNKMNVTNRIFPFNNRIQSVFELIRSGFSSSSPSGQTQRVAKKSKQPVVSQDSQPSPLDANKPNIFVDEVGQVIESDLCQLCFIQCLPSVELTQADGANYMYGLDSCEHSFCVDCLRLYLKYQIIESRVLVSCPQCSEKMHPSDIYTLLSMDTPLLLKYEEFMLRRVLVTIQDTRWCPAPDCSYAVIATGCANCPQLYCMRDGCNTSFCYHCKQYWHPNLTCEDAAIQSNQTSLGLLLLNGIQQMESVATVVPATAATATSSSASTSTNKLIRSFIHRSSSHLSAGSSSNMNLSGTPNAAVPAIHRLASADLCREEIKRCPKCQALIVKMDDGSCNHITCAVCGCEFCWLCMKEISDLHYLSPSGCTFWGKKPWSRKKKILWQLGILIGAPVGIALIAGVAVPGKHIQIVLFLFIG